MNNRALIKLLNNAYTSCFECGEKYGKYSVGCSSVWNGKCDVCGKDTRVTEARDFGYFQDGILKLMKDKDTPFDQWFYDMEGFGFRAERFWSDYENGNRDAVLEWLKTAYQMGYNEGKKLYGGTH